MLVKIEARILIFPGTDFHFPSTSSVPLGTFLGSAAGIASARLPRAGAPTARPRPSRRRSPRRSPRLEAGSAAPATSSTTMTSPRRSRAPAHFRSTPRRRRVQRTGSRRRPSGFRRRRRRRRVRTSPIRRRRRPS